MADNTRKNRSGSNLRIIAECGILAALVFIGTELRIPTALGFINLGDGVILIASYFIGPAAFFPAAIGSALGDLIAGYPVYIAPTFIIKGLMGLTAALIMKHAKGKSIRDILLRILAGIAAELIMAGGYFAFETMMYGMEAALGSVVFNLIQGGVAILLAIPLTCMIRLKKNR
ncbi:ECF transporter S component [Butyrivibrio sp. AE2032]|uniref:ECF transporter S component n=1 Tax=Butyrivibrio sp. AE2032 TaxID=1458463 RepID=UPI00068AD1F3|nr:ECF transporter S component [Butyrivibrio sp. AE2032]